MNAFGANHYASDKNIQPVMHRGIVERITPEIIEVRIATASSCGSCRAKGFCGAAKMDNTGTTTLFHIANRGQAVQAGDAVRVILVTGNSLRAVWLGYVCPLMLLLIILVLLQAHNCPAIGLGAAGAGGVAGYYVLLYAFRRKWNRVFRFDIEKIDSRT
ncbi:MAG: SoxR reducing system RseC family protein [Prevotellaceae bacterium]|jgi:sigma-E factor negative regulatory protein RseC|nr:SoxR reducing system RseC family protein [Prevotellaceae bacterium]